MNTSNAAEEVRRFQQRWKKVGLLADDVTLIAAEVEGSAPEESGFGECVWALSGERLYLQPLADQLSLEEFAPEWAWLLRANWDEGAVVLDLLEERSGRIQHRGRIPNPDPYFVRSLLEAARRWEKLVDPSSGGVSTLH